MPSRFVISLPGLAERGDFLGIILVFRGRLTGRIRPDVSATLRSLCARGPIPIDCTHEEVQAEKQTMIEANMRDLTSYAEY